MSLPLEDADYFIRVIPFGVPIPAFVRLNPDGTYMIYFNSEYSREQWLDSYEHELWHICNDDFYGDKDILDIEILMRRGA